MPVSCPLQHNSSLTGALYGLRYSTVVVLFSHNRLHLFSSSNYLPDLIFLSVSNNVSQTAFFFLTTRRPSAGGGSVAAGRSRTACAPPRRDPPPLAPPGRSTCPAQSAEASGCRSGKVNKSTVVKYDSVSSNSSESKESSNSPPTRRSCRRCRRLAAWTTIWHRASSPSFWPPLPAGQPRSPSQRRSL